MRVFVSGATGFIGSEVARRLRARGDDVVALVRRPARAAVLGGLGCELVQGDLSDRYLVRSALDSCDALVHCAGVYAVGVAAGERQPMWAANVDGTEVVLAAAKDAGVAKAVHVSSVVALGNTRGATVDEGHTRRVPYTSYYEETKHRAHEAAHRINAGGLPVVVVMPGAVYGPGDHSQVGGVIEQLLAKRLPVMPFPNLGLTLVHRDDVAAGILRALDLGRPGEDYILGGEVATMRDVLETVARVTGRTAPTRVLPAVVLKAVAPAAPVVGRVLRLPRNMREIIASADGVTFWADDTKARTELGYTSRPLERGLRETYGLR